MLEKRRTKQTSESPPPIRSSRRRCGNCSTKAKEIRTEWICSVYNIPLCLNKNKNCFSEYHNDYNPNN
ncbi:piggyBac transposable element-derived protein 4-like [Aphis craccivora]|uniref:PiggyBac transposable element-derived protein 4-like n=1 Tax=Aphis craccivora TaxID=307492 RepID=A0A6G0YHR2_APHCR|nr:piggyBac transposable element-derived protein 4-like [Aphis craccivora]